MKLEQKRKVNKMTDCVLQDWILNLGLFSFNKYKIKVIVELVEG